MILSDKVLTAPLTTASAYLVEERKAEYRTEFINKQKIPMGGASNEHNQLFWNLGFLLKFFLKGKDFNLLGPDMRTQNPLGETYFYPDLILVQGKPQFADGQFDNLTNPTVIIEIMSPSTEEYDRTLKFISYKAIPSLKEYVLVSQSKKYIETFVLQPDGSWKHKHFNDKTFFIQTCNYTGNIADAYENVIS